MQCFKLVIKKKEREIKDLIMALSDRNKAAGGKKDEKI